MLFKVFFKEYYVLISKSLKISAKRHYILSLKIVYLSNNSNILINQEDNITKVKKLILFNIINKNK